MREAIGATWIFGIVIAFIVLFTGYLAFSVNYAKAFTIKDQIVDILEKHNGAGVRGSGSSYSGPVLTEINEAMINIRYSSKGSCYTVAKHVYDRIGESADLHTASIMGVTNSTANIYAVEPLTFVSSKKHNYCIIRQKQNKSTGGAFDPSIDSPIYDPRLLGFSNYFVATFFSMNIEIVNIHLNFYVSGQTKNINYPIDEFLSA